MVSIIPLNLQVSEARWIRYKLHSFNNYKTFRFWYTILYKDTAVLLLGPDRLLKIWLENHFLCIPRLHTIFPFIRFCCSVSHYNWIWFLTHHHARIMAVIWMAPIQVEVKRPWYWYASFWLLRHTSFVTLLSLFVLYFSCNSQLKKCADRNVAPFRAQGIRVFISSNQNWPEHMEWHFLRLPRILNIKSNSGSKNIFNKNAIVCIAIT